jgi:hypothetical protein
LSRKIPAIVGFLRLGQEEKEHSYDVKEIEFAGDCVYNTQRHFIDCLVMDQEFETNGKDYLKSLKVQEVVYQSAKEGKVLKI